MAKNVKGEYDRKGAKAIALKNDIDALDERQLFQEYGSVTVEEGAVTNVTNLPHYQVLLDLNLYPDLKSERFCNDCGLMPRAPNRLGKCYFCHHNDELNEFGILEKSVVDSALVEMFGIENFRPGQMECIKIFFEGTNVSVVMTTGDGKSLIFQLTRIARNRKWTLFIIVTPLTSLCDDLLKHCLKNHKPCAAVRGSTSNADRERIAREIFFKRLSTIIIVPEILQSRYMADTISWAEEEGMKLMIMVDESHVTQEVGRPAYNLLANYSEATFLMLSATCSPDELNLMQDKFGILDKPIFTYTSPNAKKYPIQCQHSL